jgi:hypothetical protein
MNGDFQPLTVYHIFDFISNAIRSYKMFQKFLFVCHQRGNIVILKHTEISKKQKNIDRHVATYHLRRGVLRYFCIMDASCA